MTCTTGWVNLCWGTQSTSCPSFCSDLGVCRAAPVTFSLLSSVAAIAVFNPPVPLPFLSQRCCHYHCWVQPWPVAGLSWHQLGLAPSDMGAASGSFSRKKGWPCGPTLPKSSHTNPIPGKPFTLGTLLVNVQVSRTQHSTSSKKLAYPKPGYLHPISYLHWNKIREHHETMLL